MSEAEARLGRILYAGGGLFLAVLGGVGVGYWISDRGVRWLPEMLSTLSVLGLLAVAAMAYGSLKLGERGARRVRRRTIALLALGLLLGLVRLGVHWASRPSPLSVLSTSDYRRVADADQVELRLLGANLDAAVRRLLELPPSEVLSVGQEAQAVDAWVGFVGAAFALDQLRRYHEDYYRLDLSRLERDRHLHSFLLTFDAELALYQASAQATSAITANPNALRFLDLPRPERGLPAGSVTAARLALNGVGDLSRVVAGQRYLDYLVAMHQADQEALRLGLAPLYQEVRARLLALAQTDGFAEATSRSVVAELGPYTRDGKNWIFPVQAGVAEWMGDTRVRHHGRYLISAEQVEAFAQKLKPGDILLARKNWYLSNLGLPGFWPHALIQVGSQAELAQAFNQDPEVRAWVQAETGQPLSYTEYLARRFPEAWADRLRSERGPEPLLTIEAISEGVSQSALDHVSGDYVAALRPRLSPLVKAKAIARAFLSLGTPYDFDFDFATDQAVVCTELVWRSYRPHDADPGLIIPTVVVAGRNTLPANELARLYRDERGQPTQQLDFVAYLEGQEATQSAQFVDESAFIATVDRSKWDVGQP